MPRANNRVIRRVPCVCVCSLAEIGSQYVLNSSQIVGHEPSAHGSASHEQRAERVVALLPPSPRAAVLTQSVDLLRLEALSHHGVERHEALWTGHTVNDTLGGHSPGPTEPLPDNSTFEVIHKVALTHGAIYTLPRPILSTPKDENWYPRVFRSPYHVGRAFAEPRFVMYGDDNVWALFQHALIALWSRTGTFSVPIGRVADDLEASVGRDVGRCPIYTSCVSVDHDCTGRKQVDNLAKDLYGFAVSCATDQDLHQVILP